VTYLLFCLLDRLTRHKTWFVWIFGCKFIGYFAGNLADSKFSS
jgi:hypothetical protein